MLNTTSNWICFGAFLSPPVSSLGIHWPLTTGHCSRSTGHCSRATRHSPLPPKTIPRWLLPDTDRPAGYCLTPTAELPKTERDPISTSGPSILIMRRTGRFLCHALIIVQLTQGYGSGEYLSAFLRSDYGRNVLLQMQTGALHPHLECGKVREIKVLLPPPDEQLEIMVYLNRRASKLQATVHRVREAIEKLREYRTALISAAVTGKIDVRGEAE